MTALSDRDHLASIDGLRAQGFEGLIRIGDLALQDIPAESGIYAVGWDREGRPSTVADSGSQPTPSCLEAY